MNEIPVKNSALPEDIQFEDSYEFLKNRFIYLKEVLSPMAPLKSTSELTGKIPASAPHQRYPKIFDP